MKNLMMNTSNSGNFFGIDKTRIANLDIKALDGTMLNYNEDFEQIKIEYDTESPIFTSDGRQVKKIVIPDPSIGLVTIGSKKDKETGYKVVYVRMDLLSNSINNLIPLNVENYQIRIEEVTEKIAEKYGIYLDSLGAEIKMIEINATIKLNEEYRKYADCIRMIENNMPLQYYGENGKVKTAVWKSKTANDKQIETLYCKNSCVELKIYNKKAQLDDTIGFDAGAEYMRLEYKFTSSKVIENNLGGNVWSLEDEKIHNLYMKYFVRDIADPWRDWQKKNHEKLMEAVKKCRSENPRKWVPDFLQYAAAYKDVNDEPLLFDLADMKSVLRELDNNKSNARHKYKSFLNQARKNWKHLEGNNDRMNEIIEKVLAL